jgi:hypothetical protein
VAVLIVVGTLFNGLPSYLRRVGAVDKARYEAYWNAHCGPDGSVPRAFGLGRMCREPAPNRARTARGRLSPNAFVRLHQAYAFEVQPGDLPFKAAKDVGVAAMVVVGLGLWRRRAQALVTARPLLLMAALVGAAVPLTWARMGLGASAIGLRAYFFLAVAVLCAYAVRHDGLEWIAVGTATALVLQLLLLPWELFGGMGLIGFGPGPFYLPRRLAAGFILPSTLGICSATALAFCVGSRIYARHAAPLWASAVLLVVAAGSATGAIVLVAIALTQVRGLRGGTRRLVAAGAGVALLAALPLLLDRPDLLRSVSGKGGRLARIAALTAQPAATVLLGRGLGVGSNTSAMMTSRMGSDSAAVMLVTQVGLAGAACFYALLAWGWMYDARLRPFYLAVVLSSLTLNVTEAFPLNLLLGLGLAHTGWRAAPDARAPSR